MGIIVVWRWLTDRTIITASLISLIASMRSDGTSSLTTSSSGGLVAGSLFGEFIADFDSITGVVLSTVGARNASEVVKSGEGSTPL